MNQNEPHMLFGRPLSTMLSIMGFCLLFSQMFAMMVMTNIWMFLLSSSLYFLMLALLSIGIKNNKVGLISVYAVFLICYILAIIICTVFVTIYTVKQLDLPYKKVLDEAVTPYPNTRMFTDSTYDIYLIIMFTTSLITILMSLFQLKLCIQYTRHLRTHGTDRFNVSYQTRFGAPPPWGNIPQNVQNNSQQAGPLPNKPPSYADVTNTGVTVEQPTSLTQSSVVLEPTSENTQQAPPPSNQQQPAASTGHDDLDTILGRTGPPVIQTGSIMGGAFEAHSPTLPVETIQFQQSTAPDVTVFSDPFDPQVETSTVAATSAVLDVSADSSLGFVPSPTNPFGAEFSAGHSNTAQLGIETQELGLFEDIHLNQ